MKLSINPPPSSADPPDVAGLQNTDDEWTLDLAPYMSFITNVTGITLTDSPTPRDLQIVRSRLEGCIESHSRDGVCKCSDFTQYSKVDSMVTVRGLAQFFRSAVDAESATASKRTG